MTTATHSSIRVFHQRGVSTSRRLGVAAVLLLPALVLAWLLLRSSEEDPAFLRLALGLFVVVNIWGVTKNLVIPVLSSRPVPLLLTITDEGIKASHWPAELPWSEIGLAQIVTRKAHSVGRGSQKTFYPELVSLEFFGNTVPRQLLGAVPGFAFFEDRTGLVAALDSYLASPIAEISA